MSSNREPGRSLMDYLPSILQEDKFLAGYLSEFEKVLIAPKTGSEAESLEGVIAGVARYFDPRTAPEEFLPWLARWTAFTLRADLSLDQKRKFLARIISLYRTRGTADNLKEFLGIFTGATPTIVDGENLERAGIEGKGSAAQHYQGEGYDEWKHDGKPPHSFIVQLSFMKLYEAESQITSPEIQRKLEIARGLIQMEKPAHTTCYFNPIFITMRLPATGEPEKDPDAHSRVEIDTLLGDYPPPKAQKSTGGNK